VRKVFDLEQTWDILKYLSVEISFEKKSRTNQGQKTYKCRILGQKLGYDTLFFLCNLSHWF